MKERLFIDLKREDSLWERLHTETRPIVLYGTGNGADKIIDQLEAVGRKPDGVFASTGFVRHRTFRGMPVESYEDIVARLGEDIVILIAFGSTLPDVIGRMKELDARHTVFIPEVPLIGGDVFTFDYFTAHLAELERAYSLLIDDTSRALYRDMILYRLTGKMEYLSRTEGWAESLSLLIDTEKIETALDGGAFTGDSAAMMRSIFPHLKEIIAVEADARTVKKLTTYAEMTNGVVRPFHAALWDKEDTLTYSASASRGAGADGTNRRAKTVTVTADTIDRLAADLPLHLIKLDVEGAEERALSGADTVIRRDKPALLVSLYHRTEDLFTLPLAIADRYEGYSFSLRRIPCVPAWDLMLYAVPHHLCRI